ncbi:hypothetical protein AVEN_158100-1 [Araneus ventricosus]|uniref:Uncharacterized protein n=1 Tax=Araneus ventricosus TaxID=182803 RepID=A0A4Y2VTH8_ARAVE|nr:hypothetical protein AVEN_158100-1 [Araneus ventricosus]
MLGSTPHTIRNIFYSQSSNMKGHLLTHNAINQKNCIKTKQATTRNYPPLISRKKIEQEMAIKTVTFTDIPVKSPDASSTDICSFRILNRAYNKCPLSKRRLTTLCGLWKAVQEEWDKIPLLISGVVTGGQGREI